MNASRYRWNGAELVSLNETATVPLLVADSFLARDQKVAGFELHRERFTRSAERQGLVFPIIDFLDAVAGAIPAVGEFFPRIDLTERGELELWIRPAPALGRTVTLAVAPSDPREHPRLKGPDLPALAQLREQAVSRGADDAVIVDEKGYVLDGATTCLLWWHGETLCTPPVDAARLDSVTEHIVLSIARRLDVPIQTEWATVAELAATQVWAVNSLHGIRGVTGWLTAEGAVSTAAGTGQPALGDSLLDERLLDEWRAMYLREFESVKS